MSSPIRLTESGRVGLLFFGGILSSLAPTLPVKVILLLAVSIAFDLLTWQARKTVVFMFPLIASIVGSQVILASLYSLDSMDRVAFPVSVTIGLLVVGVLTYIVYRRKGSSLK